MNYEAISNENRILYRILAKQNEKIDKIKEILYDVNFFDLSYKELYERLLKIYELMEE